MNYTLMLLLEHIALVKIASALWNQDDVRALIASYCFSLSRKGTGMWHYKFSIFSSLDSFERIEMKKMWLKIEDKVIVKVPQLLLPRPLKEKIANFIKPIGLQILQWIENFVFNSCDLISLPKQFCWTPHGTVDVKRMAKVLIRDENLDIADRYKIACIYCLEDDILELWNKMPENRKGSFYSEEDPCKVRQHKLVVLWTYEIKGELSKMDNMIELERQREFSPYPYAVIDQMVVTGGQRIWSPYLFAFYHAVRVCNKAGTEYFFQKITPRERKENLARCASHLACIESVPVAELTKFPNINYANILYFLLSQMNEEQQKDVFKTRASSAVLICFLDWPWQSLFLEMANHMSDFLSELDYNYIFLRIVMKVIDGYKDCNYQKLFEEFWQQCCNDRKKLSTDGTKLLLLSKLLEAKDKKSISLILKCTNLDEHEIFWIRYADEWGLLKFFIHRLIILASREATVMYEEDYPAELDKQKKMWSEFFRLMDNLIHKNDKNNLRK